MEYQKFYQSLINKGYVKTPLAVAESWESWCGDTKWVKLMKRLQGSAMIIWWGGYPRSASAIPLCFQIILNDGRVFDGSRLQDIQMAVDSLPI